MNADPARLGLDVRSRMTAAVLAAVMVLAMLLLAAGWNGIALGAAWRGQGAPLITVLIAQPSAVPAILDGLRTDPDMARADKLDAAEIDRLLAPFGVTGSWPVPAIVEVRLRDGVDAAAAATRIEVRAAALAPGSIAETPSAWRSRIADLGRLVVGLAGVALAAAAAIVVAVTAIATGAALAERWPGVVILHGLGATEAQIARALAGGMCRTAAAGVVAGALAGAVLLGAAMVAGAEASAAMLGFYTVAALTCGGAIIGVAWVTARHTARARLAVLP